MTDVKFNSAKEMYQYLCNVGNERDIWSPKNNLYIFAYNVYGSICTYDNIDENKAKELDAEEEYWGAYLGWCGSHIYDTEEYMREVEHLSEKEIADKYTAMDFCEAFYSVDDWKDVTK